MPVVWAQHGGVGDMKKMLVSLALSVVCLTPEQVAELTEMLRQQAYRANCWAAGGTVVETAETIDCLGQAPTRAPDEGA